MKLVSIKRFLASALMLVMVAGPFPFSHIERAQADGETAPTVVTGAATDITEDSVTITGSLITDPGSGSVTAEGVTYDTDSGAANYADYAQVVTNGDPSEVAFSVELPALECGTTYYARAFALNTDALYGLGDEISFTTSACPPPAPNISVVSPQADSTGWFNAIVDWDTATNCSYSFNAMNYHNVDCGNGGGDIPEPENTGEVTLSIFASNVTGPSSVVPRSFTYQPDLPSVATGEASDITRYTATLPADAVAPTDGSIIHIGLEYASDVEYSQTSGGYPHVAGVANGGGSDWGYDFSAYGLSCGTTYHYRAYAVLDSDGDPTGYGGDQTFATSDCMPGAGTVESPYEIESCEDLEDVDSNLSASYKLADDLVCSGNEAMVGSQYEPFMGTFDGDGKEITIDIDVGTDNFAGLFAHLYNATLYNLRITGSVSGYNNVGGLAGQSENSNIRFARSDVNVTSINGSNGGSLVGYLTGGEIADSFATGAVSGVNDSAGGLVGNSFIGTLTRTYATGSVSGVSYVGGLVGHATTGGGIRDSFSSGEVVASGSFGGGLVGAFSSILFQNNYFDAESSGYGTVCSGSDQSSWSDECTSVNQEGTQPGYFEENSASAPLDVWDFENVWQTTEGTPRLRTDANYPILDDGSEEYPYHIASCSDLAGVNDNLGAYYQVTADLPCAEDGNDIMIGSISDAFRGDFDGQGHTITISLNRDDHYTALFPYMIGGFVHDVRIAGSVTGNDYTAGLVAVSSGGVFDRVVNTASITSTGNHSFTGGVAAYLGVYSVVNDSYNSGTITQEGDGIYAGGITGGADPFTHIHRSYSSGAISGGSNVGGLAGSVSNSDGVPYITDSFSTGKVTATQTSGGGFTGQIYGDQSLEPLSNNYWDVGRSEWSTCGTDTEHAAAIASSTDCAGVNPIVDGEYTDPLFFKNNDTNGPFEGHWDFDTIWETVDDGNPALRSIINDEDGDTVTSDVPPRTGTVKIHIEDDEENPLADVGIEVNCGLGYEGVGATGEEGILYADIQGTGCEDAQTDISYRATALHYDWHSEVIADPYFTDIDPDNVSTYHSGVTNEYTFVLSAATPFSGDGTGTSEDPYLITSCSELVEINNDLTASYGLGGPLNCSTEVFPLARLMDGTELDADFPGFSGVLDGDGNTLTYNLTHIPEGNQTNYLGLFGYIHGGSVVNLQVALGSPEAITGHSYIGSVAGLADHATFNAVTSAIDIYYAGAYAEGIAPDPSETNLLIDTSYIGTLTHTGPDLAGSGTEDEPYVIDSCDDFAQMNLDLTASYVLTTYLTCAGDDALQPIGRNFIEGSLDPDTYFSGTFDGGYNGLTFQLDMEGLDEPDTNVGLFGYVRGGIIRNLYVSTAGDSSVTGRKDVGMLAGRVESSYMANMYAYGSVQGIGEEAPIENIGGFFGSVGTTTGTGSMTVLENLGFNGFVSVLSHTQDISKVGGVAGYLASSTASSINSSGEITVRADEDAGTEVGAVGGLIGRADVSYIDNSNVSTEGWIPVTVSGDEVYDVGGLVGTTNLVAMDNSYAVVTATVTGYFHAYNVGGLIGSAFEEDDYLIQDSRSYGTVIVHGYQTQGVGGLIGYLESDGGSISEHLFSTAAVNVYGNGYAVGGLVGASFTAGISQSYSGGRVTVSMDDENDQGNIGGMIGLGVMSLLSESHTSSPIVINASDGSDIQNVGGLVGLAASMLINESFASGRISILSAENASVGNVGGLVGTVDVADFPNQISFDFSATAFDLEGVDVVHGGIFGSIEYPDTVGGLLFDGARAGTDRCSGDDADIESCGPVEGGVLKSSLEGFVLDEFDTGVWRTNEGDYPSLYFFDSEDIGEDVGPPIAYEGGDGSSEHPYKVASCMQLQGIGQDDEHLSAHYILVGDIDCSATSNDDSDSEGYSESLYNDGAGFTPIGDYQHPFTGTLSGDDGEEDYYAITGLMINRPDEDSVGLFGYLDEAEVSGFYIEGTVAGDEEVGLVAGYMEDDSEIHNVFGTSEGIVGFDEYTGGLVGYMEESSIHDTNFSGTVYGRQYVGGLVGYMEDSSVTHNFTTGSIIVGSEEEPESYIEYIGGLVGYSEEGDTVSYNESMSDISIYSRNYYVGDVGGLIGALCDDGGYCNFSYNNAGGDITINAATDEENWSDIDEIGGLAGSVNGERYDDEIGEYVATDFVQNYATGAITIAFEPTVNSYQQLSEIGGLYGEVYTVNIIENYATGALTIRGPGMYDIGGLAGYADYSTITDSFSSSDIDITTPYADEIGGFIGEAYSTPMARTYASGDITITPSGDYTDFHDIGGFAGYIEGEDEDNYPITDSFAAGTLDVPEGNDIGGFIGDYWVYDENTVPFERDYYQGSSYACMGNDEEERATLLGEGNDVICKAVTSPVSYFYHAYNAPMDEVWDFTGEDAVWKIVTDSFPVLTFGTGSGEEEPEPTPPVVHRRSSGGGGSAPLSQSAIISQLRAQIAALMAQRGASAATTGLEVRDLTMNTSGSDVKALQLLLIAENTGPAARALVTVGATGFFATYTRTALAEYQLAHGIVPSVGYFGAITRAQMKTAGLAGLWW